MTTATTQTIPAAVRAVLNTGTSVGRIAEEFEVSLGTVRRWADGYTLPAAACVDTVLSRLTAMLGA